MYALSYMSPYMNYVKLNHLLFYIKFLGIRKTNELKLQIFIVTEVQGDVI